MIHQVYFVQTFVKISLKNWLDKVVVMLQKVEVSQAGKWKCHLANTDTVEVDSIRYTLLEKNRRIFADMDEVKVIYR